jgi:hypothetical protein
MKPIKTLFISQPMSGLTNEQILDVRQKATDYISSKYPDYEICVLPSYKQQPDETYNAVSAVNLLGNAISLMAGANIIYFVPGWQKSKGCQIENEVARRWLEETGVELIEDGMEKVDIELSDDELNVLKAAANKMGVSLNKYVEIKLQQSMQDGTFEKVAEEIKAFPGYTVEETKALIEGEREMADAHLELLEAKEAKEKNKV